MANVMWNPEELGLSPLGTVEDPNSCYSFDDLAVWKHKDGDIYWAVDSGCSCPSPFEDYNTLESLYHVPAGDPFSAEVKELVQAIREHCAPYSDEGKIDGVWTVVYDFEGDSQGPYKTELIYTILQVVQGKL